MASPFRIPKRHASQEGSDCVLMQSPLSRLQDSDPASEKDWGESSAGHKDMMHSGKGFSPRGGKSSFSLKPHFRDRVKSFLGIEQPARGPGSTSTPPHPSSLTPRLPTAPPPFCLSNGWRPKRASDRISEALPPLKKSSGSRNRSMGARDVDSDPSDAEPSGPSRTSFWTRRSPTGGQNHLMNGSPESSSSDSAGPTSDGLLSPSLKLSPHHSPSKAWKAWKPARTSAGSSFHSGTLISARSERRLSLNRTSWLAASAHLQRRRDEERARERRSSSTSLTLHTRNRRDNATPSEPIVLSSEEEDGEQYEGVPPTSGKQMQASGSDCSGLGPGLGAGARTADQTTPPVMELDFTDLHVGLTRARPNGTLTITEHCITLPVKGGPAKGGGECEVVVVASQVRGHGLWDGGMAGGGPAPSLLFLWVTDAQAKLLQTELSIIHPVTEPGVSCVFLLVVVSVSELQAALCLSLLDTEQYCTSSSLDLSQAMHLLSSLPPPLHTHLLLLLQPMESSNQRSRSSQVGRLIQYPAPPSKGRITVTTEDLACLQHGHFLNDVIIDFYLKYLLLEKVDAGFSECCHVFSSFFFKQLSRHRAGVEEAPAILNREMRHQRVKTWTRHVNIFTKDFLFVPVNQEAHWYLLLVCFPGLEGVQHQAWSGPVAARQSSGAADKSKTKPSAFTLSPPECSQAGCQRGSVLKRACILVMDSLKLSAHENACRLLRDYLQVEWQVRRGTSRLFTADTMRSAVCRLPLQDNSSDCGLYLLQYAETFLQNPVVHFDLPVRLDSWFSRQQIRSKRDQIRSLVLDLQEDQNQPGPRL